MPTLFMLCGKIAAGKSTRAAQLADRPATILVSQDELLAALYADELVTVEDYIRVAPRLRLAMGGHLAAILRAGVSIVLDWPANTVLVRSWMRTVFEAGQSDHELHILTAPEDERRTRLAARNASSRHEFQIDEATLAKFDRLFEEPTANEGFQVVRVDAGSLAKGPVR